MDEISSQLAKGKPTQQQYGEYLSRALIEWKRDHGKELEEDDAGRLRGLCLEFAGYK